MEDPSHVIPPGPCRAGVAAEVAVEARGDAGAAAVEAHVGRAARLAPALHARRVEVPLGRVTLSRLGG